MEILTHTFKKHRGIALALCTLALFGAPMKAEAVDERQFKIESAFLYNFFNYITWPGYDAPEDLMRPVVCVYGNDPVLKPLDYVKQKMSEDRSFAIRRLALGTKPEGCQMAFIRSGTRADVQRVIGTPGVLTVSSESDFVEEGGMVQLVHNEGRIIFEINNSLLSKYGFQASSRLLALARKVD